MMRLAHLGLLFDRVCGVSLKAGILVGLIVALHLLLRHRLQPKWLYWLWLLVFARLALPWGPESEFSLYRWLGFAGNSSLEAVQATSDPMASLAAAPASPHQLWNRVLPIVWLIGACTLGVNTLRINLSFARRVRRHSTVVADARIRNLLRRCQETIGVRRSVPLVETRAVATPTLFGLAKPRLLMPNGLLDRLGDDELRHVFLHELAHCKRRDIGVNWIMQALLIVHWFNPLLWYAARRMREDQELACDALALRCLPEGSSREYGHTLIKLLEQLSLPAPIAGNVQLAGHKSHLQRRIQMIKQYQSRSYLWSIIGLTLLLVLGGCVLTNPKSDDRASQVSESPSASPTPTGSGLSASPMPSPLSSPTPTPSSNGSAGGAPVSPADNPSPAVTGERSAASGQSPAPAQLTVDNETVRPLPTAAPRAETGPSSSIADAAAEAIANRLEAAPATVVRAPEAQPVPSSQRDVSVLRQAPKPEPLAPEATSAAAPPRLEERK